MSADHGKLGDAFNPEMWHDRSTQYAKLGWVNAPGPLNKLVEMADIHGQEIVVDIGTGSGAIPEAFIPKMTTGKVICFDISADMLSSQSRENRTLLVADAFNLPFQDNFADIMTARMVFHHLPQPATPLKEIYRVLKPGGKIIIGEYVASDLEVLAFERQVFDIKEPGRHLWTGDQLTNLVVDVWPSSNITLGYGLMPQYSVSDWMGKSGLPKTIQDAVLEKYISAPQDIATKMGITYPKGGDALVDRPFAFVIAVK